MFEYSNYVNDTATYECNGNATIQDGMCTEDLEWQGRPILCTEGECLFVCLFESHEQFFSYMYLATVTITRDKVANLDLCLALTAFSRALLSALPTVTRDLRF
jgi:hypothetical protein